MNCDFEAVRYFVWENGEIVYRNTLNDAGKAILSLCAMLSLPLLIITIMGAVKTEAKAVNKVIAVIAAVVLALLIPMISALGIFVYSYSDPFYPDTSFYKFDADGVPVVIAERAWGLGAEIKAFRITEDSHAQAIGNVSPASQTTYLPGGDYMVKREGDRLTISYHEKVQETDTDENTPEIAAELSLN